MSQTIESFLGHQRLVEAGQHGVIRLITKKRRLELEIEFRKSESDVGENQVRRLIHKLEAIETELEAQTSASVQLSARARDELQNHLHEHYPLEHHQRVHELLKVWLSRSALYVDGVPLDLMIKLRPRLLQPVEDELNRLLQPR